MQQGQPQYATVAITTHQSSGDKGPTFDVADNESLRLHWDREGALDAVREGLRTGDYMVALFTLESIFKVKNIELENVSG